MTTKNDRRLWRSLEELHGSEEFAERLGREFPAAAAEWEDPVGRRRFLQLMGASLALAGVTGCTRQPKETIWPYVKAPEELVPGVPIFFATALSLGGYAHGVLVESHSGRPTKVEGHPDHPASLGATDVFAQASILGLYDPDRSKAVTYLGEIRTWADFLETLQGVIETQKPLQGEGIRILTETVTSPTLAWQLQKILSAFPKARWHQYEPAARDNVLAGSIAAFGEPVETRYRLGQADVIVSLDADLVAGLPGSPSYVREWSARRRVEGADAPAMNRLYAVESTPSLTGAVADHRLALRASEIEGFAHALAAALGIGDAGAEVTLSEPARRWIGPLSRDLARARGKGLVIAGDGQPPAVHAVAHAINHALGNAGHTLVHTEPVAAAPLDQTASLRGLVADMEAGRVSFLLVLGTNPVYHAPADLDFGAAIQKVALRAHLGLYPDETAAWCQWHVPEAHSLESWSDARAWDGTVTIVQPLVEPLYAGKTAHEVLAALHERAGKTSYDLVQEHWTGRVDLRLDFERWWRRTLRDGVVADSACAEKAVTLRPHAAAAGGPAPERDAAELELVFRTDPTIHDGRFSNNGWLQELPKPLTKLTWENAVLVSPATAARLALENGDVVELSAKGRSVIGPVWILPGQAEGALTVHLGYGRTRSGRVGNGAGFSAYALRTSDAPWFRRGITLRRTGKRAGLATTQEHHSMEGRHLVRSASLEEFTRDPEFAKRLHEEPARGLTLYPPHPYAGHAWGMAIDLSACVGCNACVVACQAENNIPVVGKEQVERGREMHWIRVDRYFEGDLGDPLTWHQPVPCMHCENAPCELVCPVGATVHSSEGLNDMVYNRCVGTRYCSNNCPYKVRRFNFLLYSDFETPSLKMAQNPDVTVRSRGVMEKCTYCVQRINHARNQAKLEDRPIRDGEIVTACQQACPADAIVFGDLNDPASRVSRSKSSPREYGILTELNTRPRTTYLAAVRNPNPELERA